MRIIELAGTCLTVEFSNEDVTELSEDFDVTLPGRFIRIPGWLTDVFRACVGELDVFLTTYLPHAERAERNACMTSPRESLRNAT